MKTLKLTRSTFAILAVTLATMLTACSKKEEGSAPVNTGFYMPGCTNCPANGSLLGGPYYSTNMSQSMLYTMDIIAYMPVTATSIPATCPTNYPYNPAYPNYYCGTPNPMGSIPVGGYPVYGNPVTNYMGQVAMRGTLRVTVQDYSTCYAIPGDYAINTVQVGQMYAGTVNGVVMEGVGPSGMRITLQINNAQVYRSNPTNLSSPIDRMGLNMFVMVNGQPCGSVSTY